MAGKIYWWSPLGVKIQIAFPLAIGTAMLLCVSVDKFVGNSQAGILFLLCFFALFIGPGIYAGVPTPFQESRRIIAKFGGYTCILLFGRWNPFFLFGTGVFNLLLYEDGVEIRTFFTSFFVPYDEISKVKRRWSHMGSGFSIECNLPDVPNRIDLHLAHPDKPCEAIQERLRLMGRVVD